MTIILDMGGVLMQHNMPECIARFSRILGEEQMEQILGMKPNAEGIPDSLMEQFECGLVDADIFVDTIHAHAVAGTTRQDVIDAWNTMHAGIPAYRLDMIRAWKAKGHHLILLSNNNALHWQDLHNHYDMSIFDHCVASHLVHSHKPHRPIYEAVQSYIATHQCEPPYHFVDDILENRMVGEEMGWHTYPTLEDLDAVV